jgi:hypothetical protein
MFSVLGVVALMMFEARSRMTSGAKCSRGRAKKTTLANMPLQPTSGATTTRLSDRIQHAARG